MNHEALATEMRGLREQLAGVTDTAVAAVDGLLIVSDTDEAIDAESLAALAAASLGLSQRMVAMTERGALHRAVSYGSRGCAAVYAVGDNALFVVLGDEGLDLDRLHRASQPVLKRIDTILASGV
ncbi:roadblock/LC7 domain-containing protein [Streptomyces sp. AN091965]|uniref:roadblock/LC7 domain-containing protein n=1 Tax=Streptomyces sp. AN091965 TaxID=2927803 RepID=UPI001F62237D|nr:roadblock/LC7 domain-containing protein [Streptomyces sp. AN091965]MCI3930937.1 roadblock/LC7 domain-containing protein [Streptomyces sp. AN091965]